MDMEKCSLGGLQQPNKPSVMWLHIAQLWVGELVSSCTIPQTLLLPPCLNVAQYFVWQCVQGLGHFNKVKGLKLHL